MKTACTKLNANLKWICVLSFTKVRDSCDPRELIQSCRICRRLLISCSETPQQFFVSGVDAIHNRLHLKEVL